MKIELVDAARLPTLAGVPKIMRSSRPSLVSCSEGELVTLLEQAIGGF